MWLRGVNPYFSRALLLVTSGSVFWIVAVGPEKTAIRGLAFPLVVAIKAPFDFKKMGGSDTRLSDPLQNST